MQALGRSEAMVQTPQGEFPASELDIRSIHHPRIAAIGDSAGYSLCSSYGCSTYYIRLDDITFDGSTVEVTWSKKREGDGLIGHQLYQVVVGGTVIFEEEAQIAGGRWDTETASGAGEAGDSVQIKMASTFTDDTTSISGTVPQIPSPEPLVTNVDVSPSSVTVGQSVQITVTMQNQGDAPFSGSRGVTVDGQQIGSLSFSVPAGGSQDKSLSWTPQTEGTKTVSVEGSSVSDTVSVSPADGGNGGGGGNGGNGGDGGNGGGLGDRIDLGTAAMIGLGVVGTAANAMR